MKKIIILVILCITFISNLYSQEYYEREEMFLDADSWFFFEDYKEALSLFLRVLEADSLNYNVMYKIGYCYLHIPGQKAKAIPYLENAIEKTTINYRRNTYSEKLAPVDAIFYLGNAYLVNNMIDEAIDAYSGFQNMITRSQKLADKDIYDTDYLAKQFDACRNAIQFQYEPVSFIAQNLGNKVNTRFNEFNAIVSGDGNSLVFTAALQFYDAIFYSKKDSDGNWSYPMNLMGQLGIDDKSASTGLSYDGTELYIYRDDDFDGNIYVSYLKNGMWTKVRKLGENINTKFWESHASVSPDNKKLYFVSNRDEGFGDLDIYVSERLTDTTWGVPVNLGNIINSRWNENTPFLTPDGKRLFFSSEGHTGMGGYDIFYSEIDQDGNWGKPVNIGYPINTTDDDIFFVPFKNGSFSYCTQFSKQGFGGQDIYHFQLFDIPEYNNILVEGVLEMDNDENRNKKDFSINIVNKLNNDTLVILKPDEDELAYQYQTPLGKNHLVFESTMNDTENQFFISTPYEIKEQFLSPAFDESLVASKEDTLPQITLDTNLINTNDKNIKIKLSLQKGNKLIVSTFYKDQLINTEEFDIQKDDFIYEYKPLIGESKIRFKLIDKNNNVKTEEVTVSYLPRDTKAELSIADKIISLGSNGEKTVKIKLSVEKGSKLFVETFVDDQLINTEKFNIRKESFVYEFEPKGEKSKINFKLVDKHNNVKNEEVVISHKPINEEFANVINDINSFNNKKFNKILRSSDIKAASSVEEFLNLFYSKALAAGLSKEQAQTLIIALAINAGDDTGKFIDNLLNLSAGSLKTVLEDIHNNKDKYENNLNVIQHLQQESKNNNYNNIDIIRLFEEYLKQSEIPVDVLLSKMDDILKSDITNILTNVDATVVDIVTLEDFKTYLSNSGKYSEEELKQLLTLMEAMVIASNSANEDELMDETPLVITDSEEKNIWMILFAASAGIILALIIIYFNRRRNKDKRKK